MANQLAPNEVEITDLFPECTTAVAAVEGNTAEVKIRYGDGSHTEFLTLRVDRMYDCLERLRKAQNA